MIGLDLVVTAKTPLNRGTIGHLIIPPMDDTHPVDLVTLADLLVVGHLNCFFIKDS